MSKAQPSTEQQSDFVLKHRIAGAAFLLFFGALFLPWVLGPPSAAVKTEVVESVLDEEQVSSAQIEEELLTALENQQAPEPEQVYISKITPLDAVPESAAEDTEAVEEKSSADRQPPATEPDRQIADSGSKSKPEPETAVVPAVKAPPTDSSTQKQAEVAPVKKTKPSVDVGWVVQVGIYTNSKGVAKVLQDLRAKGFAPTTTVVDTNRGAGTGTRIWLGPFAQRVDAAKTKTRLTEKTGEAGFIRAYP